MATTVVAAAVAVILATIADIISIILYYRRRHDMNIRKTDISFTSNFTAFPTLEVPVASVRHNDVVKITAVSATIILAEAVILLL